MNDTSGPRATPPLSPAQRRLFQVLLAEKQRGLPKARGDERIVAGPRPARIPLSLNQEGLWFLDQLKMSGANQSLPMSVRIQGALDIPALERSLAEICRRHEILRTTFVAEAGEPRQVISAPFAVTAPVTDLSGLPRSARDEEARRLATSAAHVRFDLERGPLIRAGLIRLDADEHVLLLNLHHIVTDGWSIGVLARELDQLYSAYSRHQAPRLPELVMQYADFTLWQRGRLQGQRLEAHLSFWRQQLQGEIAASPPLADRPRPAAPSFRGGHYPIALSPERSAAVRALANRAGVTPFVVLGAAFTLLLHSHSGHTDVVVGSTFANRRQRELEALIGCFVNTLPVRYDLSGDPAFVDQLARVQKVLLDVHEHQEMPLSKIVQQLQPERSLDRNPLFQVVFDVLTPDRNPAVFGYGLSSEVQEQLQIGDLRVTPMDVEGGEARFDLAVFLWDMPTGFSGTFEYSSDVYDRSTIARLVSNYESLLGHVTADVAAPLSRLCEQLRRSDQEFVGRQADEYNLRARKTLMATKRKIIAVAGPQDD